MSVSKIGVAVLVTAAAGAVALGGAALANAETVPGTASVAQSSDDTAPPPGLPGGAHTPVTGDELAKVTAAVVAKDSTVTVTTVRKDPDGSYDVLGTKDGAPIIYEVSADLTTITEDTGHGRGPGGPGGPGGRDGGAESTDTPVTGDELAKVTAAVVAKDSTVTVTTVRKDPDGSYDVLGTKDGAPVMYEVSADLASITENAGHVGHR